MDITLELAKKKEEPEQEENGKCFRETFARRKFF